MKRDGQLPPPALAALLAAKARLYVACTGAGAGLQQILWSIPGCSTFLEGATFPYGTEAIEELLGFTPSSYCSPEAAMDLATAAFLRAGAGATAIGVGLTASVASIDAHRGPHRVHAAWLTASGAGAHDLELEKGAGQEHRLKDGDIADHAGLSALLHALGEPFESVAPGVLTYVVSDQTAMARDRFFEHPHFRADGTRHAAPAKLAAALPGTFDPPHTGHFGMADAFAAQTGTPPTFWVTAEPPHKAPVPLAELLRRARLLRGRDVLFTRGEPLYLDKARAYPGCAFVIGADALVRMLDPKWGPSVDALLEELRQLGTRFYVFERALSGDLVTLSDVPAAPRDLFLPLPGRWDVSSTEIRRGG